MKHTYIEETDIGEKVFCDASCGEEWTGRPESGGFLFGSYAYCPACAAKSLPRIKGYGEEWNIRARCPEGMPFAKWVLSLRNGNNTIREITVKKCALLAIDAAMQNVEGLSPLMTAIFDAIRNMPDDDKSFRAARALDDFARNKIARSKREHCDLVALHYDPSWEGDWYVSNHDLQIFGDFTMWLGRYVQKAYPIDTLTAGIRRAMNVMRMKQAYVRIKESGVTVEHLKLVQGALWEMDTIRGDWISIFVQGKRPFGNSGVASSIFEVLEWPSPWLDTDSEMPESEAESAWNLFDEVVFALPKIAKECIDQCNQLDADAFCEFP